MPTFELSANDGQKFRIDAESPELARQAFDYMMNPPPAGAMIHEAGRSYIAGQPDLSVDTSKMDQADRQTAAAALQLRQRGEVPTLGPRAVQPAIQGATLSYGDEAASLGYGVGQALKGGSFGDAYKVAQEAQRQDRAQEQQEHPYRSTALQVGGALTQLPALAATGLLSAGARAAPYAQIAAGAGTGGLLGAAEGFGSGSGTEDRLISGGTGGLLGAALGAAAPPIAEGLGGLFRKGLDQLTVNKNLGELGLRRPAGDILSRAINADNAVSGSAAGRIAAAGPDAMLVDAGPATRGALDTIIQSGGPGMQVGRQAVDQRANAANAVLGNALDAALGAPQGATAATTAIRQSTAAARDAAYKAAYAAPIDYSAAGARDLEAALGNVPGKAISKANELMQLEGARSQQIMAQIGDDGGVTFLRMPDVRQVDYITRALRHLAEAGEDAGMLGGRTDFSRAYGRLATDIRGTLRNLVPEYGTALETAADPIARVQATRLGYEMLRPGMGRDEVTMAVRGMTQPEREAVRQGIRSHIDDLMANVRAATSDPNQDAREAIQALNRLNSRAVTQKIATVLDPAEAAALTREIGRATSAAELYAGTTRNSATFGRQAVAEATKAAQEPGLFGSLMEGRPLQATQRGLQWLFGRTPQDKVAATDEINRQVAQVLTGQRGQNALDALDTLLGAYRTGETNRAMADLLGRSTGTALGVGGYTGYRSR